MTARNGWISLTKYGILLFQYDKIEEIENHLSIINHHLRNDRKLFKNWNIFQIELIIDRVYILKENSLEIYFIDGSSIFICLNDKGTRDKCKSIIIKVINKSNSFIRSQYN